MYPPIHFEVVKFAAALSVCVAGMAWWRKGSQEEDEVMAEAADVVLDTLSDADKVSKIELHTGRNLRDQLTVEEAEETDKDRRLRRWPWRN